jgi:HEAT repeat protein
VAAQDSTPEEATARLEAAFRDGGEEEKVEAIRAAGRVPDAGVVGLLAKALREPARAVRREAIEALGWNPAPEALKELVSAYWKNTALRADDDLFALLLKAVGRHGDPSAITVLADHPFRNLTLASGTARVMGLGNIRSAEAVRALVEASERAGPDSRRGASDDWPETLGPAFRTSLAVLTGEDLGMSRAAWQKWWKEHEGRLDVAPERPPVPPEIVRHFEQYWEVPYGPAAEQPAFGAGGSPYGWIETPTKEQVAGAQKELKEARADDEFIAAIQRNAKVNDDGVVRLIAKGLSSRNAAVQLAAIDALGWARNRSALRQLHRLYHRDKDLNRREEVFAALLKSIGRHGDGSSVDVLSDSPFKGLTVDSGRARILGLGNIRDRRALEELAKGLRLAGEGRRPKEPVYLEDFRLAFAVLTGVDHGPSREAMDAWYRENKGFQVAAGRPPLPPSLKERWERYWDAPY